METHFPTDIGYDGIFFVGFRKAAGGLTQRTGTVVLKRTYEIDPAARATAPTAAAIPILLQDRPDNLVANGDFESADGALPADWQADTVTLALDAGHGVAGNALRVAGPANGPVSQTLELEEPLGGRTFTFSFSARSDALAARIERVGLVADGQAICTVAAHLTTTMTRFSASGTWPAGLKSSAMKVELRMATNAARTLWYDNVQVEERTYATAWDPRTEPRYEHDLAPYKPEGDVIVLGFARVAGVNKLILNGTTWLERNLASVAPPAKALFGWEPRVEDPRKGQAGTFPTDPGAYPLADPLPADFDNRFYNAYRRTNGGQGIVAGSPLPFVPAAARIEIERNASIDYRFTLRGDTASAAYDYFAGAGADSAVNWKSRDIPMKLDTLAIEPDRDRCCAVWRGVWPFDQQAEDAYRRLVVTASA